MEYRKKPLVIEAFKFYVDDFPEWFDEAVIDNKIILNKCNFNRYSIDEAYCEIKTPKGTVIARGGDYIIKGARGSIFTDKAEIFESKYEKVE